MFCLHYIFLPRLKKCVLDFKDSWNNHGLSTEGNMSPYQLFAEGMRCATHLNMSTSRSMLHTQDTTVNLPDEDGCVVVPRVSLDPCQVLLNELQRSVNPLQTCNDHGKELYSNTIHIVGQHLLPGCNDCSV